VDKNIVEDNYVDFNEPKPRGPLIANTVQPEVLIVGETVFAISNNNPALAY
jgi:hypothetical protein